MKEILDKIKAIIAEADAKIQEAIQPAIQQGNDTVVSAVRELMGKIHEPVKNFMKSLDSDWTDDEKTQRIKEYQEGQKDPLK